MRAKLLHAVTEYDRRQALRRSYNRNALALYLGAVSDAMTAVEAGAPVRGALVAHFNGRLLDAVLRAAGEAPSTREEQMGL
jgi:hypothetical protein